MHGLLTALCERNKTTALASPMFLTARFSELRRSDETGAPAYPGELENERSAYLIWDIIGLPSDLEYRDTDVYLNPSAGCHKKQGHNEH